MIAPERRYYIIEGAGEGQHFMVQIDPQRRAPATAYIPDYDSGELVRADECIADIGRSTSITADQFHAYCQMQGVNSHCLDRVVTVGRRGLLSVFALVSAWSVNTAAKAVKPSGMKPGS